MIQWNNENTKVELNCIETNIKIDNQWFGCMFELCFGFGSWKKMASDILLFEKNRIERMSWN